MSEWCGEREEKEKYVRHMSMCMCVCGGRERCIFTFIIEVMGGKMCNSFFRHVILRTDGNNGVSIYWKSPHCIIVASAKCGVLKIVILQQHLTTEHIDNLKLVSPNNYCVVLLSCVNEEREREEREREREREKEKKQREKDRKRKRKRERHTKIVWQG